MAFSGSGVSGKDDSLFSSDKIKGCKPHDVFFIETGLKIKVKIRKELSVGQFGFFDAPFDAPGCHIRGFDLKEAI